MIYQMTYLQIQNYLLVIYLFSLVVRDKNLTNNDLKLCYDGYQWKMGFNLDLLK